MPSQSKEPRTKSASHSPSEEPETVLIRGYDRTSSTQRPLHFQPRGLKTNVGRGTVHLEVGHLGRETSFSGSPGQNPGSAPAPCVGEHSIDFFSFPRLHHLIKRRTESRLGLLSSASSSSSSSLSVQKLPTTTALSFLCLRIWI